MKKNYLFERIKQGSFLALFLTLCVLKSQAWYCYPSYGTGNCSGFGSPYSMTSVTINSTSITGLSCTNGGVDTGYLSTTFSMYAGKSSTFSFQSPYNSKYAVYIDFNDDQDFDDADEFVTSISTAARNGTGTFTLSSTVNPGKHRMRIRSGLCGAFFCTTASFATGNACKAYNYGSTVDVTANIITPKAFDIEVNTTGKFYSDCGLGTQPVIINFTNFGTDTLFSGDTLNFGYSVNGGTSVIDTLILSSNIIPNGTGSITFTVPANFSTPNTNYTIKAFNASGKDSNTVNDTIYSYNRNKITITKFPWKENFDGTTSGTYPADLVPFDWDNDKNDAGWDWFVMNGPTASQNTGPDQDHTSGTGNYMYVEDGGGAWGGNLEYDSVTLITPCVDVSKLINPTLEFWVHDQDSASKPNKLYIDVIHNGVLYKNLVDAPSGIKPRGNYWFKRTLDLSKYKGVLKVRFRVDSKNGAISNDIAIDDIQIFDQFANDAGSVAMNNPISGDCGDSMTKVNITVKNYGIKNITKLPVTGIFKNLSGTQILTDTIRRTILPGQTDTFTFSKRLITYGGGLYNVTIATLYGDSVTSNDTLITKVGITGAITAIPARNLKSTSVCYGGSVKMYIDSVTGYNIFWFDSKTSNTAIALGDTFKTPYLSYAKTYYAEISTQEVYNTAIKTKAQGTNGGDYLKANWAQTIGGNTVNAGEVFDAKKGFYIDSISVFPGGSGKVFVNLEDSTGKLIKKDSFNVVGSSSNPEVRVKLGMYIPKGKSYRLTAAGSTVSGLYRMTINSYPITVSNILTIKDNTFNYAGNTGAAGRYYFFYNWRITGDGCLSGRTPVNAGIRRAVPGAGFSASKPFNGKIATLPSQNDTISAGDTSVFSYDVPTGLTNADFGTKWNIKNVSITSSKGVKFVDTMYKTPNATTSGMMRFLPSLTWGDSLLKWTVTYTGTGLCDSTIVRNIYISPKPKASFTADTACASTSTTFKNTSFSAKGTLSSTWDFGDGGSSLISVPTHNYLKGGMYRAKLKVTSSNGSTDTTSMMVIVYDQPNTKFVSSSACLGSGTQFNDSSKIGTGSVASYIWDFGDKSSSAFSANPSHTYSGPGSYTATLIATSNKGCKDTFSAKVEVNPLPNPAFSVKSICSGDSVKPTNTSSVLTGTLSYNWSFGDGGKDTSKLPIHIYKVGGSYPVTLRVTTDKGCIDSLRSTLVIKYAPTSKFGVFGYCLNQNAFFLDSSSIAGGGTISTSDWDFGDGYTFKGKNPKHIYTLKASVTASLKTTSADGCTNTFSKSITVIDAPLATFTKKVDSIQLTLTATGSGVGYLWKFGDGDSSTSSPTVHKYKIAKGTSKLFNLSLVISNSIGCVNSSTDTVSVTSIVGIETTSKSISGIKYYPNPVKDNVSIDLVSNIEQSSATIILRDINGKDLGTVFSGRILKGSNRLNINLSSIISGVYFLQIQGKDLKESLRIIKE